jgi:hypothetical protein
MQDYENTTSGKKERKEKKRKGKGKGKERGTEKEIVLQK